MKKNSSHVFQHIFWRGLYFFSVLLINMVLARLLAAEKSGRVFFIVNNLALILLITGISLESGATYFLASGRLEDSRIANFLLVWALIASVISFIIWYSVLHFSNPDYLPDTNFLLACFLFILGVLFTTYFTALFYARKEFGLPNKILFLVNVPLVAILLIGNKYLTISAHIVEIYFFSFFIQGILLAILFYRKNPNKDGIKFPGRTILTKVIQYSFFALAANLVYFLVNRIDYWFVKYYCSPEDLGNYVQASKLAQILIILPAILGSTLFPIFSAQEKSATQQPLTSVIRILLWINGGICVLIMISGWYIFPMLLGNSFGNMYLLFIFLIPGVLCITMNYPLTAWFSANNRIRINLQGSFIALVVICIGDLITLPHWGIVSAPVVSSAGYFSYFCYTFYTYQKENDLNWINFLMIRKSDIIKIRQSLRSAQMQRVTDEPLVQNSTT